MPSDPRTPTEQAEAQRIYRAQLADMPLDVIIAEVRRRGFFVVALGGAGEPIECIIGEWPPLDDLPPAPAIPCDICGLPCDNLQGSYLVRHGGRTVKACHRCYPTRPGDDVLVAIAKGL